MYHQYIPKTSLKTPVDLKPSLFLFPLILNLAISPFDINLCNKQDNIIEVKHYYNTKRTSLETLLEGVPDIWSAKLANFVLPNI